MRKLILALGLTATPVICEEATTKAAETCNPYERPFEWEKPMKLRETNSCAYGHYATYLKGNPTKASQLQKYKDWCGCVMDQFELMVEGYQFMGQMGGTRMQWLQDPAIDAVNSVCTEKGKPKP